VLMAAVEEWREKGRRYVRAFQPFKPGVNSGSPRFLTP
jgi:hypothetical protein